MSPANTLAVLTAVVDSYEVRARFARAEAGALSRPHLLRGLLHTARHVAEVPCGAGHFLADYAAIGASTTLIDGNAAMFAAAIEHAADVGLPAGRTYGRIQYVQELGELGDVDLVVMPNAALNQLICQTSLVELLTVINQALRPGVGLFAQVVCTHPGGRIDTAGCYAPSRQHGVWFTDRYFDPDQAAGAAQRRRRQHRGGNGTHLHVEFDYVDPAGVSLHTANVGLRLFTAEELTAAFITAGFCHVRFLPVHRGLSEVLAYACRGGCR